MKPLATKEPTPSRFAHDRLMLAQSAEKGKNTALTRPSPTWSKRMKRLGTDSLFLLPALLLFTIFVIYPALSSFYYSLTNWNGISPNQQFVGFTNFAALWSSGDLGRGFQVTLFYTIAVVIIQNTLGLLLALALHSIVRKLSNVLRVLFLIPMLISSVAVGFIWGYIYSPLYGFLNVVLAHIGLGGWQQDWLGNPHFALGSVVVASIWQFAGFNMIIFLAGLQSVPSELLEAVSIDGANAWQRFRSVIFPLLAPAFTVSYILTLIGGLKVFDIIFIMTQGGPGTTTASLAFQVYELAFRDQRFGYATALSIIMGLVIAGISIFNLTVLRQREGEV